MAVISDLVLKVQSKHLQFERKEMPRKRTGTRKSEEVRLRCLYRRLILERKIRLPYEAAVKLVGPDCAYHLYSVLDMNSLTTQSFAGNRDGQTKQALKKQGRQ